MKTDNEEFERLWQRAESEGYAEQLAAGYPEWRRRRRRTAGVAVMAAVVMAVAVPAVWPRGGEADYGRVYCNREGISDQQWADLASELLLMQ